MKNEEAYLESGLISCNVHSTTMHTYQYDSTPKDQLLTHLIPEFTLHIENIGVLPVLSSYIQQLSKPTQSIKTLNCAIQLSSALFTH